MTGKNFTKFLQPVKKGRRFLFSNAILKRITQSYGKSSVSLITLITCFPRI